ncbi:uncharacterized protein LOC143669150 isoform X3 [Tamandua tetradactyla]|uniref:uncharacterized protein LOC143669150 isoform X3 n=1 Tax=Tamandua tetradactyla TaxID=48850 RepID=UPI0040538741
MRMRMRLLHIRMDFPGQSDSPEILSNTPQCPKVTSTLISWTEKVAASHPARKKIREERDKFREKECERWIPREWRKRGTISIGSHPLTSALQTWRENKVFAEIFLFLVYGVYMNIFHCP